MILQQYLDVYKKPLSEDSMEDIHNLTEIVVEKKKKKANCPRARTNKRSSTLTRWR
jgi:hypothetical protein